MELASGKWLPEPEMEDPMFFPQHRMMNYSFDDNINYFHSFSSDSYDTDQKISYHNNNINGSCNIEASHQINNDFKRPTKLLKINSTRNSSISAKIPSKASASHIISFDNLNPPSAMSHQYYGLDFDVKSKKEVSNRLVGSLTRNPFHAQDHVIAERKRREKLSQRFISLSKLIPSLRKTDKASILGEAIKYLKQLQEQVNTLEEQADKKKVESLIFVRKTQIYVNDETSSSDENFDSQSNKPLPEIEARVSGKNVLIRIHCENNKGCISNIIKEVENLHLYVLSSNVLPFGQATLHITIVAQMEAEFSMAMKDLVKNLQLALLKFM